MATAQNFDMDQGAYWSQDLLWEDENGDPVDLTGYTARMQIRRRVRDTDPLIELIEGSTGASRITLGGTAGTILLEIDADATAELPATQFDRRWYYDLEMVPAGGQVRRLLQGRIIVSPEVTRD
jgi:hypothetical protein